jgi:arginine/ornithine transport system permease protein
VSLCVMLVSLLVALLLGLVNALIKLFGPRWLRGFPPAIPRWCAASRSW